MPPLPVFSGCFPNLTKGKPWPYFLPVTLFESALFGLAVAKTAQSIFSEERAGQLLAHLLRDSILYFGGVASLKVGNLVIWSFARVRFSFCFVLPLLTEILRRVCDSPHCSLWRPGMPCSLALQSPSNTFIDLLRLCTLCSAVDCWYVLRLCAIFIVPC